jgi:hypothetical protein
MEPLLLLVGRQLVVACGLCFRALNVSAHRLPTLFRHPQESGFFVLTRGDRVAEIQPSG